MEFEDGPKVVSRGFPLSSLIELGCDRKRTFANVASILFENESSSDDNMPTSIDAFGIMIDAELDLASRDDHARLFLTKSYIDQYRQETDHLRLTMGVIEHTGEVEAQISHLQTMLTNAIIGFTDPLEQV